MKKLLTRFILLVNLTSVGLWLVALPAFATSQDAGQVLMVKGELSAKGDDGKTRELVRRAPVFVGDVLLTGKDGQLQVRMKDGALIELGANSEFAIKAYSYKKKGDEKDGAVLSLVKGGLRTITGDIEKSTYKLETPTASMGIRGTAFDVIVCSPLTLLKTCANGTTYVILRNGTVYVTGENGVTKTLVIPGLASMVQKGSSPTTPQKPPQEVSKQMSAFGSGDSTGQQSSSDADQNNDGGQQGSGDTSDRDAVRAEVVREVGDSAIDQTINQSDAIQNVTKDQSTPIPSTSTPIPTRRPTITPSPAPLR